MAMHITRSGVALTVGIIVVTGLIIGGLYWVQQTGEQARRDEAIAIAEQQLEQESNTETALNEGSAPPNESDTTDESTTIPGGTSAAPTPELPTTGPNGIASLVAVAAVSYSIAAYAQSRRQLQ